MVPLVAGPWCDQNLRTMAAAPRIDPTTLFTPEQWQALTRRSRWRGPALVLHCWTVIGLAMWAGATWPVLIPLAVMVVGTRQLGLFILMHDAAHGLLHPNRRANDRLARWACSSTLDAYRPYHLQHHRYVQQPEDPDLVLSAPFPITRASLMRKLWRDLSGQTFFKQRVQPALQRWRSGPPPAGSAPDRLQRDAQEVARSRRFWIGNALGLAAFTAAGQGWVWWTMWALPMVSWLPMVTRIRNIAEHALVGAPQPDPLRQARTTRARWIERALLAPYWVNFHLEHHLFTQLPCWQLPKAHALLTASGATARMEVQPGYARVLRLATAG
jgi:fatty acid desaturase